MKTKLTKQIYSFFKPTRQVFVSAESPLNSGENSKVSKEALARQVVYVNAQKVINEIEKKGGNYNENEYYKNVKLALETAKKYELREDKKKEERIKAASDLAQILKSQVNFSKQENNALVEGGIDLEESEASPAEDDAKEAKNEKTDPKLKELQEKETWTVGVKAVADKKYDDLVNYDPRAGLQDAKITLAGLRKTIEDFKKNPEGDQDLISNLEDQAKEYEEQVQGYEKYLHEIEVAKKEIEFAQKLYDKAVNDRKTYEEKITKKT